MTEKQIVRLQVAKELLASMLGAPGVLSAIAAGGGQEAADAIRGAVALADGLLAHLAATEPKDAGGGQ